MTAKSEGSAKANTANLFRSNIPYALIRSAQALKACSCSFQDLPSVPRSFIVHETKGFGAHMFWRCYRDIFARNTVTAAIQCFWTRPPSSAVQGSMALITSDSMEGASLHICWTFTVATWGNYQLLRQLSPLLLVRNCFNHQRDLLEPTISPH